MIVVGSRYFKRTCAITTITVITLQLVIQTFDHKKRNRTNYNYYKN